MFDAERFIEEKIEEIRKTVSSKAVIACSGGVDSTVAAILAARALGDRLLAIMVDTGLMREGEIKQNAKMLQGLGIRLEVVNARARFFDALRKVIDPEKKRKVIGELFIRIFEERAEEFGAEYLVQGTIAPDWIESGGGLRDRIKSHHNVAGLPEKMKFKLVEPLRDLYKDEVRAVAKELGVPNIVFEKQPFPGPGLAVRIVGEVTEERVRIVRKATKIVEEEIEKAVAEGKAEKPWQYFAVLLPVKSVGVHGDLRAYGHMIAVRAVQSIDGMSAAYSKLPHDVLERISVRITNELKNDVNRVLFDITNKPPATIEFE
jgi:GMP synthase (glutamine-hydrolysing)